MKKILSCFGISAVLGMLLCSNAWANPKVITIEALAIEMSPSVLNEFVSPGPSESKGFITPDRIDAGKLVQSLEYLIKDKKVSGGINPVKIKAIEGEKASLALGADIFYMEKIDKDTFKLKKLTGKEGAGTFFEATPIITKDGRISVQYELIIRGYKLTIRKVMERAPIEGTGGLDIGFPLFSDRSASGNVVLNEGQPQVANVTQGGGQYFLVILTAKTK